MPMTFIKGSFRIIGSSPDGDSVKFYADDPGVWAAAGIAVKANSSGGVQLRLDAIDALETHYIPPKGRTTWRQPVELGEGAAARTLALLGFTSVTRGANGIVSAATPEQTPGYLLTGFADKYGRAVATVFAGARRGRVSDGAQVYLDVDELRRSVNHQLLTEGWVYPTFYSRLYFDLRDELAATAVAARDAGRGVWADDATLPGFTLRSREQLTDDIVLLPKLFRRLAEFLTLDDTGGASLTGFAAFLDAQADRLFTVPAGQATSLSTLVEVKRQTVRLTLPPEQIVFQEG